MGIPEKLKVDGNFGISGKKNSKERFFSRKTQREKIILGTHKYRQSSYKKKACEKTEHQK